MESTYFWSLTLSGSLSTWIGSSSSVRIFAGSGRCVGIVSIVKPKGTPSTIGIVTARSVFFSPVRRSSAFASQRPSESTKTVSWPPTLATGTIGTPERIAWRTKPLRPPRTA